MKAREGEEGAGEEVCGTQAPVRKLLPGKLLRKRSTAFTGGVGLDVVAERLVDVERLVDAGVEHAEPVGGGLLELRGGEQIAGLHDDLERVREVVRELADLERQILGNHLRGASGRSLGSALFAFACPAV